MIPDIGCLPLVLALFASTGGLIFSGNDAQEPAPIATVGASVILDLEVDGPAWDLSTPGPRTQDDEVAALVSAQAVLEKRFPGGDIALIPGGKGTRPSLRLVTPAAMDLDLDSARELATTTGDLTLRIEAGPADFAAAGSSREAERARLDAWLKVHPDRQLTAFHALPRINGGPVPEVIWAWRDTADSREPVPLAVESEEDWRFGRGALAKAFLSYDPMGAPALGFDIQESRHAAFKAFTGAHVGERMAVAVGDHILTMPHLNDALRRGGLITGGVSGFTVAEVQSLINVILAPTLDVPLRQVER